MKELPIMQQKRQMNCWLKQLLRHMLMVIVMDIKNEIVK